MVEVSDIDDDIVEFHELFSVVCTDRDDYINQIRAYILHDVTYRIRSMEIEVKI